MSATVWTEDSETHDLYAGIRPAGSNTIAPALDIKLRLLFAFVGRHFVE